MPTQVQFRRGTTAQNNSFTGAAGELSIDTQLKTIRVHDGSTAGGTALVIASQLTTANVSEVTNLYFTEARVFSAVTGNLALKANVSDLTTANVTEVTNLYFTNVRADARVSPAFDTANVALTNASAAFDSANTKTVAADLTTANVVEVTNLYFTNARAFANLASASTTSLAEGNNLYFTAARAIGALASNTISIGELTITGNLFVQGDTVELNTATLTIEDKTILLANGSPNAAAANGAGIEVDGASANLIYLSTGDKWAFNKSLNVDGEITATGNVTSPFFYSESDAVLKEDIEPISNPLKKILKLAGVTFTWKKSKQSGLGVIAQEVEKIVPEIVSTNLNGHKTVSYDSLVPLLIEAVKEQQKQIEYLKKKIK